LQVAGAAAAVLLAVTGAATALHLTSDKPAPADHSDGGAYSRWLYVLYQNNIGRDSLVVALDPETRRLMRTFLPVDRDPQLTLSPDGGKLYVLSTRVPNGRLDAMTDVITTFDTSTGKELTYASLPVLDGTTVNRTLHELPLSNPDFETSRDGSRLFLGEATVRRGPARSRVLIGTFDTSANELLPNSAAVPGCVNKVLLPGTEPNLLTVACSNIGDHSTVPSTNFLYFLDISDDGSVVSTSRLDLPSTYKDAATDQMAGADASADGSTIYVVSRGGQVFAIDASTQQIKDQIDLELWPNHSVQSPKVVLSDDGRVLYVGTLPGSQPSIIDAKGITAFDTSSWRRIGSVTATDFYWSLALGPGGSKLYAPSFGDPDWTIQVFDAATLEELDPIRGGGHNPVFVETARLGR
jgi:DNA-binding beta-propeller fold protein YncE